MVDLKDIKKDDLKKVSDAASGIPVDKEQTHCLWGGVRGHEYMPLDKDKPQTCGNCFYFEKHGDNSICDFGICPPTF